MKSENVKKFAIFLSVLIIMCAAAAATFNQTRIKFTRGAVTAVASGTLTGYNSEKNYVLRVREGQTLKIKQIFGKPVSIFITGPDGEDSHDDDASCHNDREITPTSAGDYTIRVVECQKADSWRGLFRFRITVR